MNSRQKRLFDWRAKSAHMGGAKQSSHTHMKHVVARATAAAVRLQKFDRAVETSSFSCKPVVCLIGRRLRNALPLVDV